MDYYFTPKTVAEILGRCVGLANKTRRMLAAFAWFIHTLETTATYQASSTLS